MRANSEEILLQAKPCLGTVHKLCKHLRGRETGEGGCRPRAGPLLNSVIENVNMCYYIVGIHIFSMRIKLLKSNIVICSPTLYTDLL